MMKLILVSDNGAVLDETEFEREDWDYAKSSSFIAAEMLSGLEAGS